VIAPWGLARKAICDALTQVSQPGIDIFDYPSDCDQWPFGATRVTTYPYFHGTLPGVLLGGRNINTDN
jgi:hypothetical protein